MRSLCIAFLVPLLALLLAVTTPVGTDDSVHRNELLHPIFPHTHLVDGRIVSDRQLAAAQAAAERLASAPESAHLPGAAFGAGGGADAAGIGLALGPSLPLVDDMVLAPPAGRVFLRTSGYPTEFREAPQDPPPDQLA
jgi:hypothetical protein